MPRPSAAADTFRAIADPTRRAILDLLARGDASAGEIARHFDVCQSTVSEHLAILRRAGLVAFEESRGRRIYRIIAAPLAEVGDWLTPLLPAR